MTFNFFVCVLFLICFGLYYISVKNDTKALKKSKNNNGFIFILIIGVILRLILGLTTKGYEVDISTFKAWGSNATALGLNNIYYGDFFLDYPPGYIYVLYFLDIVRGMFNLDHSSAAYTFIIKTPAMIADLALGYFVYKLALRKMSCTMSAFMASLILLNPAVIMNSAVWGQIDSIYTFITFCSIMLLYDYDGEQKKIVLASFLYAIAILIKPQALIFGPVYLCFVISVKDWKAWVTSIATGIITILVLSLPFTKGLNFMWLIEKYQSTLASYPYASVYAFNLYGLFGLTWAPLNTVPFVNFISWVFLGLTVIYSMYIYFKSKDKSKVVFLLFFITFSFFTLGAKMHERYLYPGLIFLLISYIIGQDKRLIWLFFLVTVGHYFNVSYVLQANVNSFNKFDPLIIIGSLINVLLFIYSAYLSYDIYLKGNTYKEKTFSKEKAVMKKQSVKFEYQLSKKFSKLTRIDAVLMVAILVVYSCFAFWSLGSNKTALTSWQPKDETNEVVFDLGENKKIDRFIYLPGMGKQDFKGDFRTGVNFNVMVSNDRLQWLIVGTYEKGYVYEWNLHDIKIDARYVKIHPNNTKMALNEIGFYEEGTQTPTSIKLLTPNSGDQWHNPENLIDEQNLIPSKPTYYDSTYFDEIYHARTADEQLNLEEAYESTHPPLGKIFIELGIAIFGMNPFGWRVAGVVFGILMLPFIYIFIKKMFNSTFFAGVGMFIFAFDFMHYTQSRIATIDTYAVFFIILIYYYMYKYFVTSFYDTKLSKTLMPLGFCGLFTGLGIASKWTVIYGVLGIAVIFLMSLYSRYKEYLNALGAVKNNKATEFEKSIVNVFYKNACITILWCVLFFVVIPGLIYVAAYIPYFKTGHNLSQMLIYQRDMYNYHSRLVDTHPFSSPWWQWPIMVKPIWYYSSNPLSMDVGKVKSIVALGNPLVWWTAIFTMISTAIMAFKKKDKTALFIIIGYASVYLVQALIPRLLFIYHYYTAVPFMVLSIIYIFRKFSKKTVLTYCSICFVLFLMFFPVLSGATTTPQYVAFLRWFPSWIF